MSLIKDPEQLSPCSKFHLCSSRMCQSCVRRVGATHLTQLNFSHNRNYYHTSLTFYAWHSTAMIVILDCFIALYYDDNCV